MTACLLHMPTVPTRNPKLGTTVRKGRKEGIWTMPRGLDLEEIFRTHGDPGDITVALRNTGYLLLTP